MSSINVLHLIDSLGVAGTERQLVLNVTSLNRMRFRSYVCYLHGPNNLEKHFVNGGVPVYRLDVRGKRHWISGALKLRKLVKTLNIDLIHTQLFESDVIGGLAGRLTGVPVVSTLANICYERELLIDNPHLNNFKMRTVRLAHGYVIRHCFRVIAVSGSVSSSAILNLGVIEDKITTIYRSLSPEWLKRMDATAIMPLKNSLGFQGYWPIILNIGRLRPQKGQRYLIEAMPDIIRHYPQAKLIIAGDGYLGRHLMEITKNLGVEEYVDFLGQRDDVQDLLRISDIFVFPSLFEGCPNALIEAMSMEVPCVASSIDPVMEVTENGVMAKMVRPQNAQSISQEVLNILVDSTRAKLMAKNAARFATNQFVGSHAAAQLSKVYEATLSEYGQSGL